jgi:hypothetical protein
VCRAALVTFTLPLVLLAVFDGGAAASSGHSPIPAFIHRTLRAVPFHSAPASSVPNFQSVGAVVPKADIVATAADSSRLHFGLAVYRDLMSATYPAISNDGGATWRIDGPLFYVAAAQGPNTTSSVGSLGPHGAYFWGQGGNFVKLTTDEGAHWWVSGFAAGVDEVRRTHGILRAVALGNQVQSGAFQAFLYESANSGMTWNLRGQLRNVTL